MDNPPPTFPSPEPETPSSSFRAFFQNRKIVLTLVLAVLLIGYGVWAYFGFTLEFGKFFAANTGCDASWYIGSVNGNEATVVMTPDTNFACDVYLASWKMFDPDPGSPAQVKFAQVKKVSPKGGSTPITFSVPVPDCAWQVDLSSVPVNGANEYNGTNLIAFDFGGGELCGSTPSHTPTPTPTLTITPSLTPTATPTLTPSPTLTPTPTRVTALLAAVCDTPDVTRINVSWSITSGTQTVSALERQDGSGPFTVIFQEPGPPFFKHAYADTQIVFGHTYQYRLLIAVGTYSNTVTVVANAQTCNAPTPSSTTTATITSSPTPTPVPVICSPKSQDRFINEIAVIDAAGGNGIFTWSAPNGTPSTGTGSTFGVTYNAAGTYNVTVASKDRTDVCTVVVSQPPPDLVCSPAHQSAFVDQTVRFTASGGTSTYAWSAPSSEITTGSGPSFSTRYAATGNYIVTVTSGDRVKTCDVAITAAPTPSPTPTPTKPGLNIVKLVRNITSASIEADVAVANPGDTVEFMIRVNSFGTATVKNVRLTDALPPGLTYMAGTTVVDGVATSDGIVSGGVVLGDIIPGRTIVVRFRAAVAGMAIFSAGRTNLTNTATATSDNLPPVSDPAFVSVIRPAEQISIIKLGRNLTRGEFAEQNRVIAYPNDTIEFIVHIRSLSPTAINDLVLADIFPANITYITNTTSVDDVRVGDGIGSSGLNLGTLNPDQEKVVRFGGKVAVASKLPIGTTSVINTAQLNNPPLIAQLPVVIINGIVGGASQVPTGAEESVFTALLISLIITMMYVAYTRTQLFKTRELKTIIKKNDKGEDTFDFKE